ncbi:MAG: helix-turn-helix domain-containing protein, partial [Rhizorhabdus sp.]
MAQIFPEVPVRSSVSDFSRLRTSAGVSIDAFAASSGFSRRTVYRWERGEAPPRKAAVRMLDTLIAGHRQAGEGTKKFRFIDLFAGIGGLRR